MNRDIFRQIFGSEPPAVQLELLLAYIDTCEPGHFQQWLRDQGLGVPGASMEPSTYVDAPSPPTQLGVDPAAAQAEQSVARLYSYFGRSLDDAWMQSFQGLTGVESVPDPQHYLMTVELSPQWWQWAQQLLASPAPVENVPADGGLIAGFKIACSTGCVFGIALCNAPTGPWVDALLRVPDNAPETTENVSLEPRRDLRAPFEFAPAGLPVHTLQLR